MHSDYVEVLFYSIRDKVWIDLFCMSEYCRRHGGGYKAASFTLSDRTEKILKTLSASYSEYSCIVLRSKIVLMAAQEKTNSQIADALGTAYATVSTWRNRFYNSIEFIVQAEDYDGPDSDKKLYEAVISVLSDKPRTGKPTVFT